MTTPSPCGPAGLIAPITLLAIRPEVLKNAIPASAATSPDSIVTPEMSTKFSLSSLAPSDWRATVTTFPPPSRRYGAVPASVSPLTGRIVTLLAPAPRSVSGLVIVRPLREPAWLGLLLPDVGVDCSRYRPGQITTVSQGAA